MLKKIFRTKNSSQILARAFEDLSTARKIEDITSTVAKAAREISNADGATFVLRDNDLCYYADENAISPLWKGQRFPMKNCISGWSMLHQEAVIIPDIYADARIPHNAYRPTFVKSLCMIPIRVENPIGAIGNYWSSGYVPTQEEIKTLQVLANSTAVALENLELKLKISSQDSVKASLEVRAQELELALQSMAHDLKTPVSGMAGMAELLRVTLGSNADAKTKDYIQKILSTGKQANEQIEQMLMLYKVNAGSIKKQDVNLTGLTQEIISTLKPQYPQPVELKVEPEILVYADPSLIRVAMDNLLSNALKYSSKKPQSRVDVGIHKKENNYNTYFVRDNGTGFDPKMADRLFVPLSRLHPESEFSGHGIGLASAAKIIKLHGGEIHAEGRPAEGATFYFSLPSRAS